MAQFEIDCHPNEAHAFDSVFRRFVLAELSDASDPYVRLDAAKVGGFERRTVTFGDEHQAQAFARHWEVAHRCVNTSNAYSHTN
jgi:hypothetical protein